MSVRSFLRAVDDAWDRPRADRIPLRIIGAGALLLQAEYDRGTKDSDILESTAIDAATQRRLIELTRPGSAIYRRWLTFIEFVPRGLPLLAHVPRWNVPSDLNEHLRHFHVPVCVGNLNRIERDEYLVDETRIELPDWLADRFE